MLSRPSPGSGRRPLGSRVGNFWATSSAVAPAWKAVTIISSVTRVPHARMAPRGVVNREAADSPHGRPILVITRFIVSTEMAQKGAETGPVSGQM